MTDTTYLSPTSELMAVNAMLRSIGETPVDTVTNITVEDAGMALDTLRSMSRAVQLVGWHWNTEVAMELPLASDGGINVPLNTLKITVVEQPYNMDCVQRGTRLYDRINHTYTFTETVKADLVVMLPFEELPEAARQFIFVSAGAVFQQGAIGSVTLDRFAKENVAAARLALEAAESETGNYNVLNGSWSVMRIIQRTTPP